MKNKLSLTIGITAFNEAKNIGNILRSIAEQNKKYYVLKALYVVNDGSTDETAKIVRREKATNSKIKFISDGKRLGKCMRLNQLYKMNASDVLITFDADIILKNKSVIDNMVKHFRNGNVGLVAANDFPEEMVNFSQKIIGNWFYLWYRIRANYNHGDTLFNVHGVAQAMRSEFVKLVNYPKGITADQDYLYFSLKRSNYTFKHAKDALVSFYLPQSLAEYYFQTNRFLSEKNPLKKEFGEEIQSLYRIPKSYKIKKVIQNMLDNPIFTVLGLLMYTKLLLLTSPVDPLNKKGMWQPIESTKGPLSLKGEKSMHISAFNLKHITQLISIH